MIRTLLNSTLFRNVHQLKQIGNNFIINKHVSKVNYQQLQVFSSQPSEFLQSLDTTKDPQKERQLKALQLKVSICYMEGLNVPDPDTITPAQWEELMKYPTDRGRERFLQDLSLKQKLKQKKQLQSKMRSEGVTKAWEKKNEEIANNKHIVYGLHHNTMFLRLSTGSIRRMLNRRLIRRTRFAAKLVVDCSYDEYMRHSEAKSVAKQLSLSFGTNRKHKMPFDLHFCNIRKDGTTMKTLEKTVPIYRRGFPLSVHQECFTEIFPRERLVYLTPDAEEELEEFNPNDIYIIGACMESSAREPIALAKAKQAGIRSVKLPIGKFLNWNTGKKSLTINQVVDIMLDLRCYGDWNRALLHVPRRKVF